ncbi:DUF2975 domain-containing protein [Polaribacter sp. R2A056_3_33]|jgi:hypothetical protein|uniref:DUF2975 domain-containing protein n=1 Tax=unclassified Polaribacter TaxID=196858 RepID=UPI001C4E5A0D|nr:MULTISPECIES: DUF2975 domain-containing protein [unclassified Polaribacter]QXP63515.1 DUF2975 domain-containing protein [Polaribacter sp. HaHaR_3_91]QXP71509.1 DUF2975 domain-containing protein [Polaribacter sp. R2A056_3_33]
MKTIQILRTLINILFYTLITVFSIGFVFYLFLFLFPELLPAPLGGFSMLFSSMFSWKMYIAPLSSVVNFVLLIVAIFYLRKCISSFLNSDFYNEDVTTNFKKAGNLFIFIGVSTIIIQLFAILYFQNLAENMIQMKTNFLITLSNILAATIDLKSVISIIIGLFFLLFSKIFENARVLKQENDLTI